MPSRKSFELFGERLRAQVEASIRRSFVMQSPVEQGRRLHYVILVAAEGDRLRMRDCFGSAVVEMAVAHIMEGDWDGVLRDIEWCTFRHVFRPRGEGQPCERESHYAGMWSEFRSLLEQALAGRSEGSDEDSL